MRTRLLAVSGLSFALIAAAIVVVMTRSATADHLLADCEPTADPTMTVARLWDEELLEAVRNDFPAPTVHSRNLFHTSAAMWDAWAAYDDTATGVFVDELVDAEDVQAAREQAISFAAYRILVERYLPTPGAEVLVTRLDDLFESLCYDRTFTDIEGEPPAALGNRIAATVLAATIDDGSNEPERYVDPTYRPVNEPLVVAESGTTMIDPDRWQPLQLDVLVAQNGLPLENNVQEFVGSQWGGVRPFAIQGPSPDGRPPFDPGPPPRLADPATRGTFQRDAVEVIRFSSLLDPDNPAMVDIGPSSLGNSPLGTYDAAGRDVNPTTGQPYEPVIVPVGDYGRAVAEYWADGPRSETPPGHWNTIANAVSDDLGNDLRIEGEGPVVDRLEWDVKLYLALNGAVHDAAIAAWGSKSYYDYVRPISMIRYMGGLGQSSEPTGPSYHPDGLPLEDGLVEIVTAETTAAGQRHERLAEHVGEVAVLAWRGIPADPESEAGGVGWILAVDWVPYQLPTFVTPSFASYVSGHSAFSRAGAEVLTAMTGSEFFPGGLGSWTIPAGSLEFELGPHQDVVLHWATYRDAADEAGLSRLYGGIHVRADDLRGREIGARCAEAAWERAQRYYEGAA